MRIAFVTFEYPPRIIGGAGVYAKNITRELARQGHEIVVFTPGAAGEKYSDTGVEVREIGAIGRLPFRSLQYWVQVGKEIRSLHASDKFDLVHVNGLSYWFLRKKIIAVPHIVTIHHLAADAIKSNRRNFLSALTNLQGEDNLILKAIEKRCVLSADRILADSSFTKRRISEVYGVGDRKIEVARIGIDFEAIAFPAEEMRAFKKKLGLPAKPVFLFVGRVDDTRKGLDRLLQAFKKVSVHTGASLLVVGSGDPQNAQKMIDDLEITGVHFLGYVDDMTIRKCYAICDIYVCPSRLEGFGLTLVEAMAYKKAIVAVDAGSVGEVLSGYGRYILVDDDDPVDGLSRGMIRLLGEKGAPLPRDRQWNGADFCWDSAGRITTGVYEAAVAEEGEDEES